MPYWDIMGTRASAYSSVKEEKQQLLHTWDICYMEAGYPHNTDNTGRFFEINCATTAKEMNTDTGLDPQSVQCLQCIIFAAENRNPPCSRLLSGAGTHQPLTTCLEVEPTDLVVKPVSGPALHQHQNLTEQKSPVNSDWERKWTMAQYHPGAKRERSFNSRKMRPLGFLLPISGWCHLSAGVASAE